MAIQQGQTIEAVDINNTDIPVGIVIDWCTQTIPSGWLECDGSQYAVSGTYLNLFGYIGYVYTPLAEQISTPNLFRVPDYRGCFHRGWDGNSGRDDGVTNYQNTRTLQSTGVSGDIIGSYQSDALFNHTHTPQNYTSNGFYRDKLDFRTSHLSVNSNAAICYDSGTPSNQYPEYIEEQLEGGNETRPSNIYTIKLIKL